MTLQTDTQTLRPELAPVPILRCKNADCKAWIREEMADGPSAECPLCKGSMIRSMKHLPKLVKKHKSTKKQAPNPSTPWLH